MTQYDVAIVGATGVVGEAFLSILAERNFPVRKLYALASKRSTGKSVIFNNRAIAVENLSEFDFSKVQLAFFSAGGSVSLEYVPKAAALGCVVIDNTSAFRYDSDVPLVIAEVNPEDIADYRERNIIANPNCSTMQMLVALKPIHDAAGITRISVSTYQSVSGTGRAAIEELVKQCGQLLNGLPSESKVYPCQIAFNVIPHIDVFQDNGYTKEEMKMLWETQKILHDNRITVNATCVRVPVFYGHSESVTVETRQKISDDEVRSLLKNAPGVIVVDEREPAGYPTAVTRAAGEDAVFVGRIREDISHSNSINLWIVSDNIRKGAALNAVQIAELLIREW